MNSSFPKLMLIATFIIISALVFPVLATSDTTSIYGETSNSSHLANNQLLNNQVQTPFKAASTSVNMNLVTTIGFDKASNGSPLLDMKLLTNQVQDQGVVFSGARVLTTGGSLNSPGYPPRSGVNVVDSPDGTIVVNFISPVSSVNVYYWSKYNIYLDAYDKKNKLIKTITGAPDTTGYAHGATMYNLAIDNNPGIASVVIHGTGRYFAIDDFSYSSPALVITDSNRNYLQNLPPAAWIAAKDTKHLGMQLLNYSYIKGIDTSTFSIQAKSMTYEPPNLGVSIGSGQCVAFVEALSKTTSDKHWIQGDQVITTKGLEPGTIIATFTNGKYTDTSGTSHVAILRGYDSKKGTIDVWDQNFVQSKLVGKHVFSNSGSNSESLASSYYVVKLK